MDDMRSRLLALVIGAVAVSASASLAETTKGAMRVSVTVIRSCTVNSDAQAVIVKCGSRPEAVRVSEQVTTAPSPTTADTRSVTIEL